VSRYDRDHLEAVVSLVDRDLEEAQTGGADMAQVLAFIFNDPKAEAVVAPVAVNRATLAAHVTSQEDLEARMPEVDRAITGWLDGFIIGMRYAEDLAKPKPEMRILDV
jgi:hypothetical protein